MQAQMAAGVSLALRTNHTNATLGSAPNPRSLVGNKPTEVRVDILPWPLKVSIVRASTH